MIVPEAVLALKAYTAMHRPIQGVLERRQRGFALAGDVKDSGNLLDALAGASTVVYCVRRATFHAGVADPGVSQAGPFTFRGIATQARDAAITLLGELLAGSPGDEVRRALEASGATALGGTKAYLVSFTGEDVLKCSGKLQIAFGTSTTLEALAPKWDHVAPVLGGQLPRTVAACANGCYIIERLDIAASSSFRLPAEKAREVLQNLRQLDLVAVTKPPPTEGGVIYRLAANALLFGPAGYEDQVAELQRTLRLPQIQRREKLPGTTPIDVSASVVDLPEPSQSTATLTTQQLTDAAALSVHSQPLERWQMPARLLAVRVRAVREAATGDSPMTKLVLPPWLEDGAQLGVEMTLSLPPMRPVRPGETPHAQREQLQRVAGSVLRATLASTPVGKSQTALDTMTKKLAAAIEVALAASGLFAKPPQLTAHVLFTLTRGEPARLPNGNVVVVPAYATLESSPRLCALMGGMAAFGLRVSFHPWKQAKQGILLQA
jgi:hypothetical protein